MEIKKKLIIPDRKDIESSLMLAQQYDCGFEYNDFFLPDILDDEQQCKNIIEFYKKQPSMPKYCTCHGAFLDVTIFSDDKRISQVSDDRVEQSLQIAGEIGAKAVVFHTNYVANFQLEAYRDGWVMRNEAYWKEKLIKYPNLNIYMENMFDTDYKLLERLACRLKEYSNFGVCLDYAHACVFGNEKEIDAWVKALGPYVKHLHINDNDFCSDLHLAVGAGSLDWKKFKNHYQEYMPEATVLIETRGTENIRQSLEFLKAL